RSDVFSLGVLLYELTTGLQPFRGGSDFEILNAIVNRDADLPSRVRPGYLPALEAVVMRALQRDRDQRYASAAALPRDLAALAAAEGLSARPQDLAALLTRLFGPDPGPSWEVSLPAEKSQSSGAAVVRTVTDYEASLGAAAPAAPVRRRRWGLGVG